MYALLKREIGSFLSSLTGYLVIIVYLLINGLFLWVIPQQFNIFDYGFATLDNYFTLAPWVFMFLIPAITMRSFSDEYKSGTIEILYTKPLKISDIIISKYLAGAILVLVALIPTFIYYITVYSLALPKGNMDAGGTWGSYTGLFFLGLSFTAIGIFASAVSKNQLISFLLGFFLCGIFYIGFTFFTNLTAWGTIALFIEKLSISAHYNDMSKGVISTKDIIYFLSVIAFFLLLTQYIIQRKREAL